jgi:hypothetical protein
MTDRGAAHRALLASAPFPFALRNFVATGLVGELERRFGLDVRFVSPYEQDGFTDATGRSFGNLPIRASEGSGGLPTIGGVTAVDMALKSVHLTGFALEYPDGSLQNLELSRRHNAQRVVAGALLRLAPRGSARREWLRRLYGMYRPGRESLQAAFDTVQPSLVVVSSPGHFWLDHFVLDEARRRRIPSVCVVLSWDNLYSRGPLCRRPDRLLVWSDEMRRQAIEIHQFPGERIEVVGPLQFLHYDSPVTPAETAAMRAHVGLGPDQPYLAYVCGSRTAEYDVEDTLTMLAELARGPYARLKVVLRPHPQGSRAAYERLLDHGVLLDRSPDLTAGTTRPEAIDVGAIRHMAALLDGARFVVSSWGTTALLEACIFDTPSVQLRWMDAVPHAVPAQVAMVRDFQRYIHMRAFDDTGARPYCDHPQELNATLAELEARHEEYAVRRARAVARLTCLPLGGVVDRACRALGPLVGPPAGRPLAMLEPAP